MDSVRFPHPLQPAPRTLAAQQNMRVRVRNKQLSGRVVHIQAEYTPVAQCWPFGTRYSSGRLGHQRAAQQGLRVHASSADAALPDQCDVAVIGAGVAGLAAARKLHRAGLQALHTCGGHMCIRFLWPVQICP